MNVDAMVRNKQIKLLETLEDLSEVRQDLYLSRRQFLLLQKRSRDLQGLLYLSLAANLFVGIVVFVELFY